MSITKVEFIQQVEAGKGSSVSRRKSSVMAGNPDGIELHKVDGGVELRWVDGGNAHRVLVPLGNIASVRFAPEAVKAKEAK